MGTGSVDTLAATTGHARLSTPETDETALQGMGRKAQQHSDSALHV